jgi:hypothetical protein
LLCAVCGAAEQPQNPLGREGLWDELRVHHYCFNSPAGRAWRNAKRAAEPLYDRYIRLSTVGLPIECPNCRHPLIASAKARGMGTATWRVPCLNCYRYRPEPMYPFGAYEAPFDALQAVEHHFIRSHRLGETDDRVAEIARACDFIINARPCVCGGHFSLAAKPRCPRCNAVAFDSYFHDVYERK